MSVKNTKIFDIGKNSSIENDLSFYSYSAVMEGLFGTKTTSVLLEEVISDIAKIANQDSINYGSLEELICKVKPMEAMLDVTSKAFYMVGVNKLLDAENS